MRALALCAAVVVTAAACDGPLGAGQNPALITSTSSAGSITVDYTSNYGGSASATVLDGSGSVIASTTFDNSAAFDLAPGTYTVVIEETSGTVTSGGGAVSGSNLVSSGPVEVVAGSTISLVCGPTACR